MKEIKIVGPGTMNNGLELMNHDVLNNLRSIQADFVLMINSIPRSVVPPSFDSGFLKNVEETRYTIKMMTESIRTSFFLSNNKTNNEADIDVEGVHKCQTTLLGFVQSISAPPSALMPNPEHIIFGSSSNGFLIDDSPFANYYLRARSFYPYYNSTSTWLSGYSSLYHEFAKILSHLEILEQIEDQLLRLSNELGTLIKRIIHLTSAGLYQLVPLIRSAFHYFVNVFTIENFVGLLGFQPISNSINFSKCDKHHPFLKLLSA